MGMDVAWQASSYLGACADCAIAEGGIGIHSELSTRGDFYCSNRPHSRLVFISLVVAAT